VDILKSIEHEQLKSKVPELRVGDTVKVHVRVKEGNRERIQVFEGIIIKKQGGGVNATFTVRRISYGVGVEKTFLIHSPSVEKVEVTRVGKARRAKLFYLRERVGKRAKTKEKIGARVETNEIIIKEEIVPGEADAVVEATEEDIAEAVEVAKVEEEAKKEAEANAVAENKEEAPAVKTDKPVVEETVDTVKEETVETVKEEPVKKEKKEEKK